jgi:hypothetical protein
MLLALETTHVFMKPLLNLILFFKLLKFLKLNCFKMIFFCEKYVCVKKPQNEIMRERESEWVSDWVKEEVNSFNVWGYQCSEYQDYGLLRCDTV